MFRTSQAQRQIGRLKYHTQHVFLETVANRVVPFSKLLHQSLSRHVWYSSPWYLQISTRQVSCSKKSSSPTLSLRSQIQSCKEQQTFFSYNTGSSLFPHTSRQQLRITTGLTLILVIYGQYATGIPIKSLFSLIFKSKIANFNNYQYGKLADQAYATKIGKSQYSLRPSFFVGSLPRHTLAQPSMRQPSIVLRQNCSY